MSTQLRALHPAAAPDTPPCVRLEETIAYVQGQRLWPGNDAAWLEADYPAASGLIERAIALVINQ